jgi:predicted RND superfamily exporter protein
LFTLLFLDVLGLNLNFANIISLPLLFGLGAATSIQTVLRTKEFNNLENYFKKSSTPSAVFFSLLTTLGAFFVLSLSSHVGTASMGKLLIISLFSIFLANLTVLIPLEKFFFKK